MRYSALQYTADSRMGDESEDFNEKIVKIGGSALLGTSVLTGLFVAIGKSQIAQRAAKKGEDNLDFAKMNEGMENLFPEAIC